MADRNSCEKEDNKWEDEYLLDKVKGRKALEEDIIKRKAAVKEAGSSKRQRARMNLPISLWTFWGLSAMVDGASTDTDIS